MARRNQTNVSIGFRLSADGSQLIGQTRVSKEELRKLGVEFSDTGRRATGYSAETGRATRATEGLSSGLSRMRGLLATLGVSLSVVGLQRLITSTTRAADEIAKLSGVTSVSTDDLQRLEFAASQTGLEFRQITQAISFMQRQMVENAEVRDFAEALDLRDLDTVGQLTAIADQFANITDPAERAAAASRLFGRSAGVEMLNFLDQGSEGIQRLANRADELGLVLDERLLRNAERFNDVWDEVSRTLRASVSSGVLEALITDTGELSQEMQDLVDLLTSEELREGIAGFVGGLVMAFNRIVYGARVVGFLKDEVKAFFGVIDDQDYTRLDDELARVNERIERLRESMESTTSADVLELQWQALEQLVQKQSELMGQLREIEDAHGKTGDAAEDGLERARKAAEDATEATRKLFILNKQDADRANRELDRFVSNFERLRAQLDPTWAATRQYTESLGTLHRAWAEGHIDAEQYAGLLWVLEGRLEEVAETTETSAARIADQADPFFEAWRSAVERIDGLFVDLWESAFRGANSFMEGLKNTFRRMLAEMAHSAMTRPIVVGMTAAMPGAASAGVPGGVGGLSSLFGGNQIGMGFQNAGDWLFNNTNLPVGNLMNAGQISNTAFGAAGLLGGLGANMLFGGRGASGVGGGLGSMAGLAVGGPLGAIAGSLLGGGIGSLFGSKPSNRAAMADLDLSAGAITALEQMTGDKAPTSETLEARDLLAGLIAETARSFAGLGAQLAGNLRLDIGGRDGIQADFGEGLEHMGQDLDEALANIVDRLIEGAEGMDEAFSALIRGIEGGEDRVRMTNALSVIQTQRMRGDSVGAGREAFERSQMAATDIWREQTAATQELIRTYDGSLAATEQLAEAYAMQRDMSVELAMTLEGLSRSVAQMFGETALRIRESIMGEEELYNFRRDRFDDLVSALSAADSEAEIERLSRQIDQLFGTMWSSLDEVQRQAMQPEFLDAVLQTEQLAQERISAIQADIQSADTHLADHAQEALRAAGMQSQAAQEQLAASQQFSAAVSQFVQAVNTPLRVNMQGAGGEVHTR